MTCSGWSVTGNSLAPHLHFHVMSGPQFAASNGLPYEVDSFKVTGRNTAGTAAFDEAEAEARLKIKPADPPERSPMQCRSTRWWLASTKG